MNADTLDQALEVAADAILRRARVLEGQDPEVAEVLRTIVTNLEVDFCFTPESGIRRRTKTNALRQVANEILAVRRGRAAKHG